MVGEQLSRVGEPDPAAVLGEELLPHLAFQLRQLLGDRRRGDMQVIGRATDRTEPGEGIQGPQALQVQHVSNATRMLAQSLTCPTRLNSSLLLS